MNSMQSCVQMQECALSVNKINPRQYVAKISQIPGLEVWFQRASDVVRKLRYPLGLADEMHHFHVSLPNNGSYPH